MSKQDKYTRSAKGQQCQIRITGCNGDTETTVLAHLGGAGMAMKHDNIFGAYACSHCHDLVDGRIESRGWTWEELKQAHLEAVIRTQKIMIDEGVLIL